ncbi:MAG: ATP-binding protein, partial [Pseudomonadota bacterium]
MVERGNRERGEFDTDKVDTEGAREHLGLQDVTVSEARLDTVLETAADGIIVTNDRARVLMYNAACEKMFGYEPGEVIGRNIKMLMPQRHARTHDDYVRSFPKSSRQDVLGVAHEVSGLDKNGNIIPIELTIGEAHTPAGRQFIGILRDLRQRHVVQNRINELQQQLLHFSRRNAVDEMGAAMAHELNQPLTAMTLYLQAIEKKTRGMEDFDPDVAAILERAIRETERASQIIQRMRRFGKRAALSSTTTDLAQLIRDAIELTTIGYRTHRVRVETDISPDLPDLRIDPVQIEQILVNLLRNAIEAVGPDQKGRIDVAAQRKGDYVAISVRDSGPGISDEMKERLFKTFGSSKETGMGLGLAISNTIAQSHGGYFDVDPGGNGHGATFTLNLP